MSHSQQTPRKKMRKGTRSCVECRRRKIRCTFHPDLPDTCNECRQRRLTCVDQEHAQAGRRPEERSYNLRERVAELEAVVHNILKRSDVDYSPKELNASSLRNADYREAANTSRALPADPQTSIGEGDIIPSGFPVGNAPILQLFDNDLVGHEAIGSSSDNILSGPKDAKVTAVLQTLLSFLLPPDDIASILRSSLMWWSAWQMTFPDVNGSRHVNSTAPQPTCVAVSEPGELAKMLVCLCISMEQLPCDFNRDSLAYPINIQDFTEHCVHDIDRLIVSDDTFASTQPGIETQLLLSTYYLHKGLPRKAWITCRKAIGFAQLSGDHIAASKWPCYGANLSDRRSQIWCSLAMVDRFISLILGLPYAVADIFLAPDADSNPELHSNPPFRYMKRLSLVLGRLIERNLDPSLLCLSSTMALDKDLEDMIDEIPGSWWLESGQNERDPNQKHFQISMLKLIHHAVRALLHLPYILKFASDRRVQYCQTTAVESARACLSVYKFSHDVLKTYLDRITDFLAFMMSIVLVVNMFGYSDIPHGRRSCENTQDIALVQEMADRLLRAGSERNSRVSAESGNILKAILERLKPDSPPGSACKITLPFFGVIVVGPGKRFDELLTRYDANTNGSTTTTSGSEGMQNISRPSSPRGVGGTRNTSTLPAPARSQNSVSESPGLTGSLQEIPSAELCCFPEDLWQTMWPDYNGLDSELNVAWFD